MKKKEQKLIKKLAGELLAINPKPKYNACRYFLERKLDKKGNYIVTHTIKTSNDANIYRRLKRAYQKGRETELYRMFSLIRNKLESGKPLNIFTQGHPNY